MGFADAAMPEVSGTRLEHTTRAAFWAFRFSLYVNQGSLGGDGGHGAGSSRLTGRPIPSAFRVQVALQHCLKV